MSTLPGRRHRTLTPSGVIGEADIAAMEAANAALRAGAHGLTEQALDLWDGRYSLAEWTPDPIALTATPGAARRAWFDLPMLAGSVLTAVDAYLIQGDPYLPITFALEHHRAQAGTIETILTGATSTASNEIVRHSFGLIDAALGRPLGWTLPTSPGEAATIRIESSGPGMPSVDEIIAIVIWHQRIPPS